MMRHPESFISSVIVLIKPQKINAFIEKLIKISALEIMPPDDDQEKIIVVIDAHSKELTSDYITMMRNTNGVKSVTKFHQQVYAKMASQ
jgi:nitrate reductase NapAB chaperone NapD